MRHTVHVVATGCCTVNVESNANASSSKLRECILLIYCKVAWHCQTNSQMRMHQFPRSVINCADQNAYHRLYKIAQDAIRSQQRNNVAYAG